MAKRYFLHVDSGPYGDEWHYRRLSAVPEWQRDRVLVVDVDVPNKVERTYTKNIKIDYEWQRVEPRGQGWTYEGLAPDGLSSIWIRARRVSSRRAK
jgi:hypothetical protein